MRNKRSGAESLAVNEKRVCMSENTHTQVLSVCKARMDRASATTTTIAAVATYHAYTTLGVGTLLALAC